MPDCHAKEAGTGTDEAAGQLWLETPTLAHAPAPGTRNPRCCWSWTRADPDANVHRPYVRCRTAGRTQAQHARAAEREREREREGEIS